MIDQCFRDTQLAEQRRNQRLIIVKSRTTQCTSSNRQITFKCNPSIKLSSVNPAGSSVRRKPPKAPLPSPQQRLVSHTSTSSPTSLPPARAPVAGHQKTGKTPWRPRSKLSMPGSGPILFLITSVLHVCCCPDYARLSATMLRLKSIEWTEGCGESVGE